MIRRFLLLALLLFVPLTVHSAVTTKTYFFQAGVTTIPSGLIEASSETSIVSTSNLWTDTSVRYGAINDMNNRNFGAEDSLQLSSIVCDSAEAIMLIKCDFASSITATDSVVYARLGFYDIAGEYDTYANLSTEVQQKIVNVYRCMTAWVEGAGNGAGVGTLSLLGANGAIGLYASNNLGWATPGAPSTADAQSFFDTPIRSGIDGTPDTSSVGAAGWYGSDKAFSYASIASPYNIPVSPEASYFARTRKTPPAGSDYERYGFTVIDVSHFTWLVVSGRIQNNGLVFTNSLSLLTKRTFYASHEHATITLRPFWVIRTVRVGSSSASGGSTTAVRPGGVGSGGLGGGN